MGRTLHWTMTPKGKAKFTTADVEKLHVIGDKYNGPEYVWTCENFYPAPDIYPNWGNRNPGEKPLHDWDEVNAELQAIYKQGIGAAKANASLVKAGIARYGWASVPMEEALASVALDISGRGGVVFNVKFSGDKIGTFDVQLVEEFLRAICREAGICLHVNVPYGTNDHHIAEAAFKAIAQALRSAKAIDPARKGEVPSTKGTL